MRKSEKTGDLESALEEVESINKSLSASGNVVSALTTGGMKDMPCGSEQHAIPNAVGEKLNSVPKANTDMKLQLEEVKKKLQLLEDNKVKRNEDFIRKEFLSLFIILITLINASFTVGSNLHHLTESTRFSIFGVFTLSLAAIGMVLSAFGWGSRILLLRTLGLTVISYACYILWIMVWGAQGFVFNVGVLIASTSFILWLYTKITGELGRALTGPCSNTQGEQFIGLAAVQSEAFAELDLTMQPSIDMQKVKDKRI